MTKENNWEQENSAGVLPAIVEVVQEIAENLPANVSAMEKSSQNETLDLLQSYEAWAREKQLYPDKINPENFMKHLQNERNQAKLDKLQIIVDKYGLFLDDSGSDIVRNIVEIIRDEKK